MCVGAQDQTSEASLDSLAKAIRRQVVAEGLAAAFGTRS